MSEILEHCGVTESQIDRPCSNEDLAEIAGFFGSRPDVAPHLGLDEKDLDELKLFVVNEMEKRLNTLQILKWKSKFGFKATYRWLVEALVKVNMADCAEHVCQLVGANYRKWICRSK